MCFCFLLAVVETQEADLVGWNTFSFNSSELPAGFKPELEQ